MLKTDASSHLFRFLRMREILLAKAISRGRREWNQSALQGFQIHLLRLWVLEVPNALWGVCLVASTQQ
jgi:hypothetical protein